MIFVFVLFSVSFGKSTVCFFACLICPPQTKTNETLAILWFEEDTENNIILSKLFFLLRKQQEQMQQQHYHNVGFKHKF